MTRMMISYDTEVGAYYLRLTDEPIARTVHISDDVSDDVAVDLDAAGGVHGLELLCSPGLLTEQERSGLIDQFPAAGQALTELEQLLRPPLTA